MKYLYFIIFLILLSSCSSIGTGGLVYNNYQPMSLVEAMPMVNDTGKTILERFEAPLSYQRVPVNKNSFAYYLRTLPLKPDGVSARYYNGKEKENTNIYASVVDMPISSKNLQSCSHAILRLKSEYHYNRGEFDKIKFRAKNKDVVYSEFATNIQSKEKFNIFLDYAMENVSSISMCKDLSLVSIESMEIGDIFIQRNNPKGHAVIVVDMAVNTNGDKIFLLAQSFRPAQEIQILTNPERDDISPWYELKNEPITTPEWRFLPTDLNRFKDFKGESN